MDYMNSHGFTVYLKLSPEQLVTRLESSRAGKRPLLGNRKGEDLRLFIEEGLVAREPFYSQAQLIVSGTDEEMMKQVARIA